MTRNQSLAFRVLLFLAGAGIIVLAFFLTTAGKELDQKDAFIWTSIGLQYLVFFLPFFFSAINMRNFPGKIPVLILVWLGILLYIAASITIIVLLTMTSAVISLKAAIIIQAVLLFIFFVDVYFAYIAGTRAGSVAAEEAGKQQYLARIKSKAQILLPSIERFPSEIVQKSLRQALDDIKYISPVNDGAGIDLEAKISKSLAVLSELANTAGSNPAASEQEALNLQALVNERKLLRN
jgi:hypothetical protein